MKMSTFGPIKGDSPDFKKSVSDALDKLGVPPLLAIVYPSHTTDLHSMVATIRSVSDVPLVGATTGGAGFTEKGMALDGVVGAFIGGENLNIQIAKMKKSAAGNYAASIDEAVQNIKPVSNAGHSVFVLADALSCDGEQLSRTLTSKIPVHWRIFGGFAGDGWTFKGTKIILNDTIFSDGGVLVYINDGNPPSMGVRHGFCPLDENQDMSVTGIEGNMLKEIDDRPALQVYKEALQKQGVFKEGDEIVTLLARYPIGVKTVAEEKWKIRSPLGIEGNALVLAGSVPPNSIIRVMSGDKEELLSAAKEAIMTATTGLNGKKPSALFVIDCAVRKQMLTNRYVEQVKTFRLSSQLPMLGFASYGEFARSGGTLEGFHNTTAVTVLW